MRNFIIVSWLLIIASVSLADVNAVMSNGVGARAAAMGFSQVADARGVEGIYWNPAALSEVKAVQLSTYASDIYGTDYKTLGVVFPAWGGKWGLLALSADQGSIPQTALDINGRPAVSGTAFDYNSSVLYLSYAREVGKLAIGTNMKYLAESLAGNGASGFGLDIGAVIKPVSFLAVGAKVENLLASQMKWDTSSGNADKVGLLFRAGLSIRPIADKLALDSDLSIKSNSPADIYLGGEYSLLENLFLRGGIFASRPTLGVGLKYVSLTADYAYVKGDDYLDDSHRLSLSFTF